MNRAGAARVLVDANLLVYAKLSDMSRHAAARGWLEKQLNGASRVGPPLGIAVCVSAHHDQSADSGFRIYRGLKLLNPLAS